MKILLISDLHIGSSARCLSMVPTAERENARAVQDIGLKGGLVDFLRDNDIQHIIVCGDISDKATYEQFAHFDIIAGEFCLHSGGGPASIFFTPGNHDVDWEVLRSTPAAGGAPGRHAARYQPIKTSEQLRLSSEQEHSSGSLYEPPYFATWKLDDLFVLSINTAAHDNPDVANHEGSIDDETLSAIDTYMEGLELSDPDCPKVLLIHHHPISYPNPVTEWKDFSIIQSTEDIVQKAVDWGFDLIAHGHRHTPSFRTILNQSGNQISVLACGSFSQLFPQFVYERINNQFHVLEFGPRDAETNVLTGNLTNFAFSTFEGWRPSNKPTDGIDTRIPFGPNQHRPVMKETISSHIRNRVEESGECELSTIRAENDNLKFVTDQDIFDITHEVVVELGYRIFGETIDSAIVLGS